MRVFFYLLLIGHDLTISHVDDPVEILPVPGFVGDHHHGLVKVLVEFLDQFQDRR